MEAWGAGAGVGSGEWQDEVPNTCQGQTPPCPLSLTSNAFSLHTCGSGCTQTGRGGGAEPADVPAQNDPQNDQDPVSVMVQVAGGS